MDLSTALPSTSPASPPTARYQEKREALLGAAAQLFNEQGVKGATLADIASAVGLVTNSVTYYYRKKEDLARACFLRSIAAFDALSAQAMARHRSVPQRLHAFFESYAGLLADIEAGRQPQLVLFSDIRALPQPHIDEVFAAYTNMFRHVRDLLRGPETSGLAREDFNARGHILLSVLHGVRSFIDRFELGDYARVAARVADVLLHGLPAAGQRWRSDEPEAAWPLAAEAEGPQQAFLRAATALVNEQGYRGASVDRISARLNVTKGSFYHHNDTKHDLITECFERSFAVVRAALAHAEAGPEGSGYERACAVARALVRYQLSADGPLLRVTATSALPDAAHRERVRRTMQRLNERMGQLLVDGMVDGSVRALDPALAAQSLLAAVNAAAELHRWLPGATQKNASALYVRPVMEGLLCPAAGAKG